MVAGRDPEHPQPVEADSDGDRLPGHICPDGDKARQVDEDEGDRLGIDNVVVNVVIGVLRVLGGRRETQSISVRCKVALSLASGEQAGASSRLAVNNLVGKLGFVRLNMGG